MPDLVQPLDPAQTQEAPPEAVQPAEPQAEAPAQKLDRDLLKIPAVQALMAGSPAAVSAPIKEFSKKGDAKTVAKHKEMLQKAGFFFYRSMSGDIGVIGNSLHIHPQDIQAADKMGKLQQVAPPWDVVDHAVSKSGHNNPVLTRQGVPGGPAAPSIQAPPQMSAQMPPGASPAPAAPMQRPQAPGAQRALMAARIGALNPGSPTSGPAPGAGRLLNQILKPVV